MMEGLGLHELSEQEEFMQTQVAMGISAYTVGDTRWLHMRKCLVYRRSGGYLKDAIGEAGLRPGKWV
jgi:hypothetical protein